MRPRECHSDSCVPGEETEVKHGRGSPSRSRETMLEVDEARAAGDSGAVWLCTACFTSIDIVAQEQVVCVGRFSAHLEELLHVQELAAGERTVSW